MNSSGAPSQTQADSSPDHAIILDTEGDVYTKISVCCYQCGQEMLVGSVVECAEVAVVVSVRACGNCDRIAYREGYQSGSDETTKGF